MYCWTYQRNFPISNFQIFQIQRPAAGPLFKYYVVLDYEATCEENQRSFPNEIIEFPVISIQEFKRIGFGSKCKKLLWLIQVIKWFDAKSVSGKKK